MLEFAPNTYMLEYQDGAYLCNGTKRVEAPLNLETLEEAVRQCPKLQIVSLDDALFGDECFPVLARIPKLNMLALLRGRQIAGHGLELLKDLPLKDLFLQRTALDDEGLAQAAQIKKLEHIYIAACHQVTSKGLLAISWRDKLQVSDGDMQDEEGLAGLFTEAERKAYEDARTYKIMKNRISLDSPELQAPIHALLEFFDGMNQCRRHYTTKRAISVCQTGELDSPSWLASCPSLLGKRRDLYRSSSGCRRAGHKKQILALYRKANFLLSLFNASG